MFGVALYYPYIDIKDRSWLRSAILFWDRIQTIAPSSIDAPYQDEDTKICEKEGYLKPLRCDLYQGLLDDLGKRMIKLMERSEWIDKLMWRPSLDPASIALMHGEKLSSEVRSRVREITGIHPEKMSLELRALFQRSGALALISAGNRKSEKKKVRSPNQKRIAELSREIEKLSRRFDRYGADDRIFVSGQFSEVYMSALAAALAREIDVSPLTNDEPSLGINLRCLMEDIAATGPTAAAGALVSVVMEGIRIDPEVPVIKLLAFRERRADQLIELSGKLSSLQRSMQASGDEREMKSLAKRIYREEIRPNLVKLKKELKIQSIGNAWDGFQTASTFSVAPSVAAWAVGLPSAVAIGIGAFITAAGIGVKSYLAQAKIRASSPYTYLFDVEKKFHRPRPK